MTGAGPPLEPVDPGEPRFTNLQLRLMTAAVGLPLLVGAILVGGWPFAILAGLVADGKTVAVHCRQGIGRSAVIAAGVLIALGADAESAVRAVADARGCPVPETPDQRRWIADYAASLTQAAR